MKLKFYAAALLALALAGCNNNNGMENPLANGPVPMSFTAAINSVATRATGNNFQKNDAVGIFPVKDGQVETAQANINYTYQENKFTANRPYYFQNLDTVIFNAYYPHQDNLNAPYTVEIDTKNNNQDTEKVNGVDWRKNDYLFATDTTTVKTPSISFTGAKAFKHVMSSVAIKFKAGTEDGVADLQALTGYTLGGVVMEGEFNCSTGKVSLKDDATAGTIAVNNLSCEANKTEYQTASLILLPQTVTGSQLDLTVTFNNTTYNAKLSLNELQAGKLHVFPVTIKNKGLEISSSEIKEWEESTETGVDATM